MRCSECWTKVGRALKEDPAASAALPGCGVCKRQGWCFTTAGHEHTKPQLTGEIRRQAAPTEETARRVFDAL